MLRGIRQVFHIPLEISKRLTDLLETGFYVPPAPCSSPRTLSSQCIPPRALQFFLGLFWRPYLSEDVGRLSFRQGLVVNGTPTLRVCTRENMEGLNSWTPSWLKTFRFEEMGIPKPFPRLQIWFGTNSSAKISRLPTFLHKTVSWLPSTGAPVSTKSNFYELSF